MKSVRLLFRIAVLSFVAAAFVGLTELYGGSQPPVSPGARWQAERQHRPPAPQVDYFGDVIADGVVLAVFAFAGRIVFRLRLSPVSRRSGNLMLLDLDRNDKDEQP